MTDREKIIKIIEKNGTYNGRSLSFDYYVIQPDDLADALIAAGIGDTTNLIVENKVLQRDVDNLMRTLEEGTEEFREVQYRAEVAERALHCLARSFVEAMCKDSNTPHLIDGFIKDAYRQAKKELAEEKKDD